MSIDELLKERASEVRQIAEEQEADLKEVEELVRKHFESLPSSRIFTPEKKFSRALSFASADLTSYSGKRIELVILGYTDPRDWNKKEREAIIAAWEKGSVSQETLLKDGKVMFKKSSDGRKAVSEIYKLEEDDNGVPHVLDGKILESGETPIPRDYTKTVNLPNGNSFPNRHYGYPLGTRFTINMYGVTPGPNDIEIPLIGNIGDNYDGKWADPNSDDFLRKTAPSMGFYDATVTIDEDKSSPDCLVIKSLHAISPKKVMIEDERYVVDENGERKAEKFERPLGIDEYVYSLVETNPYFREFKEYLSLSKEEQQEIEDSIFLVDFRDLDEFHELIANRNSDGTLKRSEAGNNYSEFGKFGLAFPVLDRVKTTKFGNQQLVLVGSGRTENVFPSEFFPEIDPEGGWECLISFSTVKKNTRYDYETRKQITDPINGDVNISNLMGFKKTFELM